MKKQTFAIELNNVTGTYEFNMVTEDLQVERQDVLEYFCRTHGFTPQFVDENIRSLFRVEKEFYPIET